MSNAGGQRRGQQRGRCAPSSPRAVTGFQHIPPPPLIAPPCLPPVPPPPSRPLQANRQLRELREIAKGVTKQLPGVIRNATAKIDE